jgi:hypothetical protein
MRLLTLPLLLPWSACTEPPPSLKPQFAAPPERWSELDDAREWPTVGAPFVSRGHGVGHYLVQIRASPAILDAYRTVVAGRVFAEGTSIAAFHRSRETGAPGSIYAMTKRGADRWEFVVVEPEGRITARGDLALCARCHSEAASDYLFGVPAPQAAAPGSADRTPDPAPPPPR